MGDEALTVIRAWATTTDRGENQDLVYTDILSRFFISAPAWISLAVLGLSALIAFFAFWRSGGQARWRGLAAPVVSLVIAALLGTLAWAAFEFVLRPGDTYWWARPDISRSWCIALGLLGAPLVMGTLGAKTSPAQAETGGQFWFAALGVLSSLALPGISILFVLPAALHALGSLVALAWKPAQPIAALLAGLVALVIWAPMLALNELALGFQFPFANTMLFAVTALPWLGALARLQAGASWRAPTLALGVVALCGVVAAAFTPSATRERPLPLNIAYLYDASANQGSILAGSARRALPRELTSRLNFSSQLVFPGDVTPYWAASVQTLPMRGPALEGVSITPTQGGRVLHARLRANGAYRIYIRIPIGAGAGRVRMNGADANYADVGNSPDARDYVTLGCQGRSCEAAEIEMTLGPNVTDWAVIGLYPGAAAPALPAIAARPPTRTTVHFGDDAIVMSKTRV